MGMLSKPDGLPEDLVLVLKRRSLGANDSKVKFEIVIAVSSFPLPDLDQMRGSLATSKGGFQGGRRQSRNPKKRLGGHSTAAGTAAATATAAGATASSERKLRNQKKRLGGHSTAAGTAAATATAASATASSERKLQRRVGGFEGGRRQSRNPKKRLGGHSTAAVRP